MGNRENKEVKEMELSKLLAEGTMKAAALMIAETARFPKLKALGKDAADNIVGPLRFSVKANLPRYMAEWKNLVEMRAPESLIRAVLNAQCNEMALRGLIEAEGEL